MGTDGGVSACGLLDQLIHRCLPVDTVAFHEYPAGNPDGVPVRQGLLDLITDALRGVAGLDVTQERCR
jgi:hypothetical protein